MFELLSRLISWYISVELSLLLVDTTDIRVLPLRAVSFTTGILSSELRATISNDNGRHGSISCSVVLRNN
jgi:hypothetical protein